MKTRRPRPVVWRTLFTATVFAAGLCPGCRSHDEAVPRVGPISVATKNPADFMTVLATALDIALADTRVKQFFEKEKVREIDKLEITMAPGLVVGAPGFPERGRIAAVLEVGSKRGTLDVDYSQGQVAATIHRVCFTTSEGEEFVLVR